MVGGGEGGARAVKVDHSSFLRIFFFEDMTSDVDLSLNGLISTHFSRKILSLFFVKLAKNWNL